MNEFNQVANIKVFGIGGGGSNAVNRMVADGVKGVTFYIANTDVQVMKNSDCENKIVLGRETTMGLGAGGEIDTIFGIAINEQLGDAIIVTVIATGFEQDNEPDEPKQVKSQPRVGNPGVRTEPQQSGRRPQVREDDEDDKEIPDFFFNR